MEDDAVVTVRRHWNDWHPAGFRLSDISGWCWDRVSGLGAHPATQPFIYGYVSCDAIVSGRLAHACLHGEGPHQIRVCVVKKDNPSKLYTQVLEVVGPKPETLPKLVRRRR